MSEVLKADASMGEAYVQKTLAVPQTDVWMSCECATDTVSLAAWNPGSSGAFLQLEAAGRSNEEAGLYVLDGNWYQDVFAPPITAPVTAEVWTLLEVHRIQGAGTPGSYATYVAGVLVDSGSTTTGEPDIAEIWAGQVFGTIGTGYVRNIKIGTTRGGTDLFSDDFSDGTLDAWTSSGGDVSVVDDPFPALVGCVPNSTAIRPVVWPVHHP